MAFRDLVDQVDATIFEILADVGYIEGRRVQGMFSAPWLQPQFGKLNTGLREPRFVIRLADADGVEKTQRVRIDLPPLDGGGEYDLVLIEPDGTGLVALILRMRP
jgi:hypothetical protein